MVWEVRMQVYAGGARFCGSMKEGCIDEIRTRIEGVIQDDARGSIGGRVQELEA